MRAIALAIFLAGIAIEGAIRKQSITGNDIFITGVVISALLGFLLCVVMGW